MVENSPVTGKNKPIGPTLDSQAKKTQSINEIMVIEALEFSDFEVGEILTPQESIIQLKHQSEVNQTFFGVDDPESSFTW